MLTADEARIIREHSVLAPTGPEPQVDDVYFTYRPCRLRLNRPMPGLDVIVYRRPRCRRCASLMNEGDRVIRFALGTTYPPRAFIHADVCGHDAKHINDRQEEPSCR